ncbi:MAG TPA: cytochrome P450, partial [Chryseosolibacter sp.]|nr:cytochrome P450 [Chryseosolibacter sp.]
IIRNMIRTRQDSGNKFDDLLDMLLDARYEDTGLPMEEHQVIDEILILLIAGHETTANALSWTLYLLANHREVLLSLRASTENLDVDNTVRDHHLNAVINESMRLYPPAWISDRVSLHDDAYRDYTFPANTIFALFYYGLHRDPKYWEDAAAFKPDRFLREKNSKDKPKAFYPFGAGPRLCIGNNFAMAEMTLFLQAVVQKFDFLPTPEVPVVTPLVTLRPDRVILEVRKR